MGTDGQFPNWTTERRGSVILTLYYGGNQGKPMFDEMWSEIADMQAEIFDFGDINDDIPSVLNLTEEEMDRMAEDLDKGFTTI
jgi:hypothetical protein